MPSIDDYTFRADGEAPPPPEDRTRAVLWIVLAGLLFWNPVATIAGYLAVGLLIAIIRWFVPNRCGFARACRNAAQPGFAAAIRCASTSKANRNQSNRL